MKLNQKGITLVELIAGLSLVSIIAIIAWSSISIGMRHGAGETSKTIMQQDVNLMVSSLMAAHRGSEKYSIIFEDDQLKIDSCDENGDCELNEIHSKYNFTGSIVNEVVVDTSIVNPVIFVDLRPESEHTEITLKITDLNNDNRSLTIETTLSRLLTNSN
ncbi:prepilin-type N-terminal cleavage/methylation domain-containing protein [Metaplanococcus flavidus]|uniref:Prepilin-type N-terminal cleavage/methylation domain-containing protein n=1 Tax=Metaplanococcus flavidus TaxID=569883 RepID=A0ABW3L8Q9_9BACL